MNNMSPGIYKQVALSKRSFFQKLFKQHSQENAVKELNNLLSSKPILQVSKREIEAIENKYEVNILREFKLNLEEFYAVYLNQCLKDKNLDDSELEELKHLKSILNLDEKSVDKLHSKLGELIYKQSFKEAVSDGRLTRVEKVFLNKLETDLKLPEVLANETSSETRQSFMSNYVAQIVANQRLSPDEEKKMYAVAASLNIDLELDDENLATFSRLKMYWLLRI
jgi:hypothetical protein